MGVHPGDADGTVSDNEVVTDSAVDGIADTPQPPYTAVIFTSLRTDGDQGYGAMAVAMNALASEQAGYLGMESAREGVGITVSYWRDQDAARRWKQVAAHLVAQRRGRAVWYRDYRVRVATVLRDYGPSDQETV